MKNEFNFPEDCKTNFSRKLSSVFGGGNLWTAVQMEKGRKTGIALYKNGEFRQVIETDGFACQPSIAAAGDGLFLIAWNEVKGEKWKIRFAFLEKEKIKKVERVFESGNLLLAPSACIFKNRIYCAWAGKDGSNIRIYTAVRKGGKWLPAVPVSKKGHDSFRPEITSDENFIYCAYDSYRNKRYEIACSIFDGRRWKETRAVPPEGERWLGPKILSCPKGTYIAWTALKEVEDRKLGIRDHFPFAMAGRVSRGKIEYLYDESHPGDKRIIADLREGLLAVESYFGHFGLRRNPCLACSDKGDIWCFWEAKVEKERNPFSGHLFGRKLDNNGRWSPYYDIYGENYSYSVPKFFDEKDFRFSSIDFYGSGEKIITCRNKDLGKKKKTYSLEPEKWKRWTPVKKEKTKGRRSEIRMNGKKYRIFWGDTHCHSNFSPDAEGEVDELINYAKDIAGLDFACIIDNDYYPHKSLTEAEWRIHQGLSRHFSERNRFIVFAGWEFTYHRRDLEPSFNHRTVIYPFTGGALYRRIDRATDSDKKLMAKLEGRKVICYPHHCTYEIIDPEIDKNVEIVSSWRVCMEESDFAVKRLQGGEVFGFIGSSDSHRALSGTGGALTGVIAEELTPGALYEGYMERRLIASQGCRVKIDFNVGGLFTGQAGIVKGAPIAEGKVSAGKKIDFAELVRDGIVVFRKKGKGKNMKLDFTDAGVEKGSHFYFLRVKLSGDPSFNTEKLSVEKGPFSITGRYPHNLARNSGVYAWTSPVWIKKMEAPVPREKRQRAGKARIHGKSGVFAQVAGVRSQGRKRKRMNENF